MIVRKRKLRRALAAGCLLREETLRLSHATLVRSSLNLVIAFQCKIFEHTLGWTAETNRHGKITRDIGSVEETASALHTDGMTT